MGWSLAGDWLLGRTRNADVKNAGRLPALRGESATAGKVKSPTRNCGVRPGGATQTQCQRRRDFKFEISDLKDEKKEERFLAKRRLGMTA
jgi:hypothetical protein